jgi:hypothetical protein
MRGRDNETLTLILTLNDKTAPLPNGNDGAGDSGSNIDTVDRR